MKIYTFEDPDRFVMRVVFIVGDDGVFKTAFNFATDTTYTIKPGEALPKGCYMNIPRNVFAEMLKGFAEMANDQGLKLNSDLKREGKLEATERHLEDMRRLVFQKK